MGLLAEGVQLIPDATVLVQLVIFLITSAVLTTLVFHPALHTHERRHDKTVGDTHRAEALLQKASEKIDQHAARIHEAKTKGSQIKESLRSEGFRTAQQIMEKARAEGLARIEEYRADLNTQLNKVRGELDATTATLATTMATKILERQTQLKTRDEHGTHDGNTTPDIH